MEGGGQNLRSVKIHQDRKKCLVDEEQEQRTGVSPGQTEDIPHSAQSLQATEIQIPVTTSRKRIRWPTATNKGE